MRQVGRLSCSELQLCMAAPLPKMMISTVWIISDTLGLPILLEVTHTILVCYAFFRERILEVELFCLRIAKQYLLLKCHND